MQLCERAPESFDAPGSCLENQHRLDFIGDLSFPAVQRPRARLYGAARDQPSLEQLSNERDRLLFVGNGRKNDDCVGVRQAMLPVEIRLKSNTR